MRFNTTYDNHIRKFIIEDTDEEKDEDIDDEEKDEKKSKKKSKKKKSAEDDNTKDNENVDPDNNDNEIVDSKKIDLIVGEVEVYLLDAKEDFHLHIKFLDDPKMSGYIHYDAHEDVKRVYNGINTVGELLNYINIHAENVSSIEPLLNLLKREIIAIKRDLSEEDIADLALEFPL